MSDITAKFSVGLGNGSIDIELGRSPQYDDGLKFGFRLCQYGNTRFEENTVTVDDIDISVIKKLVKQLSSMVEMYEME